MTMLLTGASVGTICKLASGVVALATAWHFAVAVMVVGTLDGVSEDEKQSPEPSSVTYTVKVYVVNVLVLRGMVCVTVGPATRTVLVDVTMLLGRVVVDGGRVWVVVVSTVEVLAVVCQDLCG